MAKPLNDLLKKDQKFEWTKAQQDAFDKLKKRFTEEPVLMMPDHTKLFQIETDTSKYATGAFLTQLDANGDRHPVSFILKTFSPAERNYKIYNQELLAIVRALEEWRHLYPGIPTYDDSLVRPQESDLLSGGQETEQMTSKMVTIPLRI